jgi:hypothetical protein
MRWWTHCAPSDELTDAAWLDPPEIPSTVTVSAGNRDLLRQVDKGFLQSLNGGIGPVVLLRIQPQGSRACSGIVCPSCATWIAHVAIQLAHAVIELDLADT